METETSGKFRGHLIIEDIIGTQSQLRLTLKFEVMMFFRNGSSYLYENIPYD